MSRFVTGVTVIATDAGDTIAAMTANAVTAVSLEPVILLVCVRNESRMRNLILARQRFSVNILAADQGAVSRHYGGRPDSTCPARWTASEDGVPVLEGANASIVCEIDAYHRVGDHTVIYGLVTGMTAGEEAAPALVFAGGRYHDIALGA